MSGIISSQKSLHLAVLIILFGFGVASTAQDTTSRLAVNNQAEFNTLSPDDPTAYFTLGETLIASAISPQDYVIASEVLAIGVALAAKQMDLELAASMCIALAAAESNSNQVTELWDLALFLDSDRLNAWKKYRNLALLQEDELRMDAVKCLHAARFYKPEIASALIDQPEIKRILTSTAQKAGLDPKRIFQTLSSLIDTAVDDSCRGRVFITRREDGVVTREVCPDHHRPIGMAESDESLNNLLRLESYLFTPTLRKFSESDWNIATYLHLEVPVVDPSVSNLLKHYQVDIAKPYRKGNRWDSSP